MCFSLSVSRYSKIFFVLFFLRELSAFQKWLLWSSGLGFLAKKGKDAVKQSSTDLALNKIEWL